MKKHLLLMLFLLPLLADATTLRDSAKQISIITPVALKVKTPNYKHALSLQLEAGTQGAGGDLRFGLLQRLSARLGASFIPVTKDNALNLPGFQSTNSASVNFYNVHLLADFVPFKRIRGFRLVGGAAYLYKAEGGLSVIPTGTYKFRNLTVTGADIGNLNMNVSWKGVAPYAGLGLFRSFPHHLFNFNLDLGTYYLNQPATHIVGTGLLVENSSLEPQFNENLKDYRWLPVLQLNFNFRLK